MPPLRQYNRDIAVTLLACLQNLEGGLVKSAGRSCFEDSGVSTPVEYELVDLMEVCESFLLYRAG